MNTGPSPTDIGRSVQAGSAGLHDRRALCRESAEADIAAAALSGDAGKRYFGLCPIRGTAPLSP